ncbi:transcription initiation factor TFIID subunit A-domain-containing protein [Epithele typhae]|uniref:transcription initiation factor TFIID subunit A-domain-containing protein n=1 Tax=Epithele typhae TaxID=378194 RepID=UPI00200726B9|nr:transcription initiation factor TFIID subunit A-domain-containing protein [Epithele typhae]KAH9942408.1 transcription initiation factor TFIID subunit A-domain-containing protein [Epithele typhae]
MASNPPPQPPPQNIAQQRADGANNIITALGNAFKSQTGDPLSGEHIAQLLIANMNQLGELAKQGKLTQQQIVQLKQYAEKHKVASGASTAAAAPVRPSSQGAQPGASTSAATSTTTSTPTIPNTAFKTTTPSPFLGSTSTSASQYPITANPTITPQGAVQWQPAQQGRPSLTGGLPSGRISGAHPRAPPQVAKAEDSMLNLDDNRTRRKNTPGDQSMRRSIQDLVSSIDPNVKIEPEVEDLLLDIADEFIDSVTNFGCRLAKHRGGDTLEVKDLQLHLERNHNIRIPGFASDEARISLSQTTIAPAASNTTSTKKGAQNTQMTLRSHRLSQVQFAKKEAKLM